MRLLLLVLAVLCTALPAAAQYAATLVADINPGNASAFRSDNASNSLTVYDGRLFFAADDGEHGRELWAYDTATGEVALVADINPGSGSAISNTIPFAPTVFDNRLFFPAYDSEHNTELWAYDAATNQALHVADIWTGTGNSKITDLTIYDGRLFFVAENPSYGRELWVYDAVTDEATLAADIIPGAGGSYPKDLTVYAGRLFFGTSASLAPEDTDKLWAYDAASGEAVTVAELVPMYQSPNRFTVYGDRLFFSAKWREANCGPPFTCELRGAWVYDADIDEAQLFFSPEGWRWQDPWIYPVVYDDKLFAAGYGGIYAYDAVTDEITRANHSNIYADSWSSSDRVHPVVFENRLFYPRGYSAEGVELEFYDVATSTTQRATDINPGSGPSLPGNGTVYDGRLFFSANDGMHGRELWALSPIPLANESTATPQSVQLHAPHPNPAQDGATVTFNISEAVPVRVEVLDVLGRRVALLADGPVAAGEHTLRWEAGALPSGLYLVRLTAGNAVQTQRLTLVR